MSDHPVPSVRPREAVVHCVSSLVRTARAACLNFLFILFTLIAIPAQAQVVGDAAPLPRVQMADRFGIDLRSGRRTHTDGTIVIGAADCPNLSYSIGAEQGGMSRFVVRSTVSASR